MEELKREKEAIEKEISKLLIEFYRKYGAVIQNVNLIHDFERDHYGIKHLYGIKAYLDIRI